MMRQTSSRNQRSKGLRSKNILQICLLTAVFFWLLYQLKHSYDKKKGLDEDSLRILDNVADSQAEFDLGGKDLPRDDVIVSDDKGKKEDENEEVEEEEDGESQRVLEDEEVKGNGDDGTDDQENEQGDEQEDQERGDEEGEDGEETLNEEEKDDQVEEAEFLDDQEPEEGSSQEVHEERYKKDDASSAVHQENEVPEMEGKNSRADEERLQNNEKDVETEGKSGRSADSPEDSKNTTIEVAVSIRNDTIQNNSLIINGDAVEEGGQNLSPPENQTNLHNNSAITSVSENQVKLQIDKPADAAAAVNDTDGKTESAPIESRTLSRMTDGNQNTTISLGSPEEDKPNLKRTVEQQPNKSNTTDGRENLKSIENLSNVSLSVNKNEDAAEGGSAGSSHRIVIDEERDSRVDLSTLPDIRNDIKNMEDEAAE